MLRRTQAGTLLSLPRPHPPPTPPMPVSFPQTPCTKQAQYYDYGGTNPKA